MHPLTFADPWLYATAAGIVIAGILASSAGIGGGGLFVALLMFVGGFTPHEAVPLSKVGDTIEFRWRGCMCVVHAS